LAESWLWEVSNEIIGRIPDPVDYVEMRRTTFGAPLTMELARIKHGEPVPAELYHSRVVQDLENTAADYCCMLNDLFSFQKEIQFEGEVHNIVLVVDNFLGCGRERAAELVADLMAARLQKFQHVIAYELPALYADRALEAPVRAALDQRARELQDLIAANLNWHQATGRYKEPDLYRRFRPTRANAVAIEGPTGIGTGASRVDDLTAMRR
jgi:germacradienol/geosmin synthase